MIKSLLFLLCLICFSFLPNAQIITPVVRAGFGVDGDLRANFFNNFVTTGNDDWFSSGGTVGTPVIDTTGAAAMVASYTSDVSPFTRRMATAYRSMRVPAYTIVNNRLWLDALWVRDYHATDTTVFVQGSSKNGLSPAEWGGTIQSIPDKNEILDMMMHLRRAGDGRDPNRVDSLWFFGGLSIENTSGNRYFDFELYQTDIYYDRNSRQFFGYGPDGGHTSWQFDAAGNIVRAGDIIFSASYQSAQLSKIEARIWVDKEALNMTPAGFSWSGQFDGANNSAQYGYASILPKTSGSFYTGLENGRSAWAGPFQLVRGDNSLTPDYLTGQFMEFSVNLTKLGLDPATMLGGDVCGTPFNRLVVKTRASDAFTSSLKDFVAPIDLFLAPRVQAETNMPVYCGANGISELRVMNPSPSSVYAWSTLDGNIVGETTGQVTTANAPGTYVVRQQLAAGCNPYAYDTVQIVAIPGCGTLSGESLAFQAVLKGDRPLVSWTSHINHQVTHYELEGSLDGRAFFSIKKFENRDRNANIQTYSYEDQPMVQPLKYYRLKIVGTRGTMVSQVVSVQTTVRLSLSVMPNPASHKLSCSFHANQDRRVQITVVSISGYKVYETHVQAGKGVNTVTITDIEKWPEGMYTVLLQMGAEVQRQKVIVHRSAKSS